MKATQQEVRSFEKDVTLKNSLIFWILAAAFLPLFCVSLIEVAADVSPAYQINFNREYLLDAALYVTATGLLIPIFSAARFSFGFLVSFYLMAVTTAYIWLSFFTSLEYNHAAARLSAVTSLILFCVPALFARFDRCAWPTLSVSQMDKIVPALVISCAVLVLLGASYGFHLVGFIDGEFLRGGLGHPVWMNYAIPIATTAIIPFCYSWFLFRNRIVFAAITLIASVAFYPLVLNKATLFTPAWLFFLTIIISRADAKIAVVLSLLIPLAIGMTGFSFPALHVLFRVVNFRMMAIPPSGLDHYYHYFSSHPATGFCQIGVIGKLFHCYLSEQLGVTMAHEYALGNYNASLLATEGIASVGMHLAPASALICGLIISLGNLASSCLPPRFILLSASALGPVLMNVPLSTSLITYGGIVILVLWAVAPREFVLNRRLGG